MKPLIIRYTNLLYKHNGNFELPVVKEFLQLHSKNKHFIRQAEALNKVWTLKFEIQKLHELFHLP